MLFILADNSTGDTAEAEYAVAILLVWTATEPPSDVAEQAAPFFGLSRGQTNVVNRFVRYHSAVY